MSTDENTASASEDMKRKFKEALDKKNAATHLSASGADSHGAVDHAQGKAGQKREFRRKSG